MHRVDVLKEGYAPFTTTVTVANGQTEYVTATLTNEDLDGDGLPDYYEENGYRDGFGRWHTLNPNVVDTDGDGLTDGYETSEMVIDANGRTYFKQRSDPNMVDTDDDGLDDYMEDYLKTDPTNPDTDYDLIKDGEDDEPHVPVYIQYATDRIRDEVALRLGAVFGETGLKGEVCNGLIGGDLFASKPSYAAGWIVSGLAGIGDVRDFLYAVSQSDTLGATLTGLGIVPYFGDCEKSAADIAKWIGKYPEGIRPLAKFLAEQRIIEFFSESDRLKIIDDFFPVRADGMKAGTYLITEYGLDVGDLVKMMGRGVDLSEVVHVVKVGDDAIPLTRDSLEHAIGRHVDGTIDEGRLGTSLFPTSEPVIWHTQGGVPLQYPGISSKTRAQIEEKLITWITEAIEAEGLTKWPKQRISAKRPFNQEEMAEYGISEVEVIIYGDGIETVFASKGPQVFKWYNEKWNPTV
ncbi:MAG: hypothetical protein M0P33_01765 [Massilibacteroides sp.]|nr:hypothetical protein [Massilibacteroides sp.]